MAYTYYTVVSGDTLGEIAQRYSQSVATLASWNSIENPDVIYVGQRLVVNKGSSDPTPAPAAAETANTVTVKHFGLQSGTDRTMMVSWTWSKSHTKEYEVQWWYSTGDGINYHESVQKVQAGGYKESLYNAPAHATSVAVQIRPISETKEVDGKETTYWTADWSTKESYRFADNPPSTPPVPSVSITDYTITIELQNLQDLHATDIEFKIIEDDKRTYTTVTVPIKTGRAVYTGAINDGHTYKVAARSIREEMKSSWSEYSSIVKTVPTVVSGITDCRATSARSVYLEWSAVGSATSYDIEYTTERRYFDGSDGTQTASGITLTHHEFTSLDSGKEYFFRVRAVNESGQSGWSSIVSVRIGELPGAPTTWSERASTTVGRNVTLYWMHNPKDGSNLRSSELEITVGSEVTTHTIDQTGQSTDNAGSYIFNASGYSAGAKMSWRVRTKGALDDYGDWSIVRTLEIYAPPSLALRIVDQNDGTLSQIRSFPFYAKATAGPSSQTPIGYYLSVVANESYETMDDIGNRKYINRGDEVYSKTFDVSTDLLVEFTPGNIHLENNVQYTFRCGVTMNSGLNATDEKNVTVGWGNVTYQPNAEVGIDKETASTRIRPYCQNLNGQDVTNVYLSVYRRETDGSFTEIIKDIDGAKGSYIVDPHPALDYARYRIVSKSKDTGALSYYDMPSIPMNMPVIMIQWDEDWREFNDPGEAEFEQSVLTGSYLKLPFNIDISESSELDTELVEYIGRKYPVAYRGTIIKHTETWNTDIPADDVKLLHALRRLSLWDGDVYVREPTGKGYWAQVKVSLTITHCEVVIPVSLTVTRVEGGA